MVPTDKKKREARWADRPKREGRLRAEKREARRHGQTPFRKGRHVATIRSAGKREGRRHGGPGDQLLDGSREGKRSRAMYLEVN